MSSDAPAPTPGGACLVVRAVDGNAMLGRLAAVLGQHRVDHFAYTADQHRDARVVIAVRGDAWQVARVAARVRRVVGVLDVVVEDR